MATTGIINGKILRVYDGGVAISKATECSISFTAETREASHKDSGGYKENLPGLKSVSISTSGLHAFDSTSAVADLTTKWLAGTQVTVRFSTEVVGDDYYECLATISSIEINAPNEENSTYSATFESSGAITQGVIV